MPRTRTPPAAAAQRLAGQWIAVEWTTAGELSLAATLTSGQCFRWRPRAVRIGSQREAPPRKATRSEQHPAPQIHTDSAARMLETWTGTIGRHVVELATVDSSALNESGKGGGGLIVSPSASVDPAKPPPLSPLQKALSPRQQLLLVRTWNAHQEPVMPALTLRQWPAASCRETAAVVSSAEDLAHLVRRYLRLDDDMLAAWAGEWLPDGWAESPMPSTPSLPATPVKPTKGASKSGKARMSAKEAQADRIAKLLPRDNSALRQRLASNALQVAAAASPTAATPKEDSARRPRPYGVRLLRQDPWENLLSFLCSQNNHQTRIAGMVESLCLEYGEPIPLATSQDLPHEWLSPNSGFTRAFPTAAALAAKGKEERLRELGFGYRAKFIAATAPSMAQALPAAVPHAAMPDGGFSAHVASQPTVDAQRELLIGLPGVGRKVADCVLLFAYDRLSIVPIDTHMAQITQLASAASWGDGGTTAGSSTGRTTAHKGAKAKAAPSTPKKKGTTAKAVDDTAQKAATVTLTPRVHDAFQAHYTHVFGRWAGWAHCLLFAPRLTTSSITLPREWPAE